MLHLRGGPALSRFRREQLIERLPGVADAYGEFQYCVAVERELEPGELELLAKLVGSAADADRPFVLEPPLLFVAPRLGTISPWASKATDIAHASGLRAVRRIERVLAYRLVPESGTAQALVARAEI